VVARKTAPEGFDIIIDDASHFGDLTKIAFWHLFDNHLKPSGLYVIEDWGTGYWSDWTDGKAYRPRSELYSGFLSLLRKLGVIFHTLSQPQLRNGWVHKRTR
jgi:spermidine synthase